MINVDMSEDEILDAALHDQTPLKHSANWKKEDSDLMKLKCFAMKYYERLFIEFEHPLTKAKETGVFSLIVMRDQVKFKEWTSHFYTILITPKEMLMAGNINPNKMTIKARHFEKYDCMAQTEDELIKISRPKINRPGIRPMKYNLSATQYYMMLGGVVSTRFSKTIEAPFEPTSLERDSFKEWRLIGPYLDHSVVENRDEKLSYLSGMTYNLAKVLDNWTNVDLMPKRDKKGLISASSLTSTMQSFLKKEIDLDHAIRTFYRDRHDVFMHTYGRVCDPYLDASYFDKTIEEVTKYSGIGSNMTPDLLYFNDDANVLLIGEFAVTDRDPAIVEREKREKYSGIREMLETFYRGKITVNLLICVYSTRDPEASLLGNELCSQLREQILSECKDIKLMTDKFRELMVQRSINPDQFEEISKTDSIKAQTNDLTHRIQETIMGLTRLPKRMAVPLKTFLSRDMKSDVLQDQEMVLNQEDPELGEMRAYVKGFSVENALMKLRDDLWDTRTQPKRNKDMSTILNMSLSQNREEMIKHKEAVTKRLLSQRSKLVKEPKVFKFPLLDYQMKNGNGVPKCDMTFLGQMADGTMAVSLPTKLEDDKFPNREGIGFHPSDADDINTLCDYFSYPSCTEFQEMIRKRFDNVSIRKMCEYKAFEVIWFWNQICMNLIYLEGRRKMLKKDNDIPGQANTRSVFKYFENLGVSLLVRKGTLMTKEKQIRYKLVTRENVRGVGLTAFHKLQENILGFYESKWLTMSSTDMKHFSMVFQKACALVSLYKDCYEEDKREERFFRDEVMKSKAMLVPLLVLMEHKRGTSTTLQYNRYILHSMTAWASNRMGVFKDINSDPIRSKLEGFIRMRQMEWSIQLSDECYSLWKDAMKTQLSDDTQYDTLKLRNMFDPDLKVELSWSMNDIYLSNLFEKTAGFQSHRVKAIMAKMAAEEISFLEQRQGPEKDELIGIIADRRSFISRDDKHHTFDRDFTILSAKKLSEELKKSPEYSHMLLKTTLKTCREMMSTSSSLSSGPFDSKGLENSQHIVKDFSFNNVEAAIRELSTRSLLKMVSKDETLLAAFSLFPKAQIGGPREILIQSIKIRFLFKFVEDLSRNLCSLHSKDMMTKGTKKHKIQSDESTSFRENAARISRHKAAPKNALSMSLNTDASKWAPSKNMVEMMYFIIGLDLPEFFRDAALSLLRAMTCKVMFLPEALKEKWVKKQPGEKEEDQVMEWLRGATLNNHTFFQLCSGMGQGMLHYLSSLQHCAKDDLLDDLMKDALKRDNNHSRIQTRTLISSDDLTKMVQIFYYNKKELINYINLLIHYYDSTNRLANIHTNWKKTALQILIKEFNSYFTRGKRASLAVVKDVYTAMQVVDLTEASDAIKMAFSSLKRCFFNGMYMTSIQLMADLLRDWFKECYRIGDLEGLLMKKLGLTDPKLLPYQLGYFPNGEFLMEMCLYGPDISMHNPNNSEELNSFYRNLYTATDFGEMLVAEQPHGYKEPVTGKWKLLLPTRTDKRVLKEREKHKERYKFNREESSLLMDRYTLCNNYPDYHPEIHRNYVMNYFENMSRKYEFSDTACTHSLIRALSMATRSAYLSPPMDNTVNDIVSFVDFILGRGNHPSLFDMASQDKEIISLSLKARDMFKKSYDSENRRHNKLRTLRMYSDRMSELITVEEFLEALFSTKGEYTSRFLSCARKLCNMLTIPLTSLLEKPDQTIEEMFPGSTTPRSMFNVLLNHMLRSVRFTSMEIISSFSDKGSTEMNLLHLMLDKTFPHKLLSVVVNEQMGFYKKKFVTEMSVSNSIPQVIPTEQEEEELNKKQIKVSHSKLTVACSIKFYMDTMGTDWHQHVDCEKVFFRMSTNAARDKIWNYFDLKVFSQIRTNSMGKTFYSIWAEKPEEAELSQAFTMTKRDIGVVISRGGEVSPEKDMSGGFGPVCDLLLKRVKFSTTLDSTHSAKEWSIRMQVLMGKLNTPVASFRLMVHKNELYQDVLANTQLDEDLMDLLSSGISLKHLQDIMERNSWLPNKGLLKRSDWKDAEAKMKSKMEREAGSLKQEIDMIREEETGDLMDDLLGMDMNEFLQFDEDIPMEQVEEEGTYNLFGIDDVNIMGILGDIDELVASFNTNLQECKQNTIPSDRNVVSSLIARQLKNGLMGECELSINKFKRSKNISSSSQHKDSYWYLLATNIKAALNDEADYLKDDFIRIIIAWYISMLNLRHNEAMPKTIMILERAALSLYEGEGKYPFTFLKPIVPKPSVSIDDYM